MKILILAQHYAPEEVSGAVLATELAEELSKRGHDIAFLTCVPNYPGGRVFSGYRNRLRTSEHRNGVRIIRVWSYITPSKGLLARILNHVTFCVMALLVGWTAQRPDLILNYSPPMPLGLSAWCLSKGWGVPWVLRVEDLYPDAAVAAGVLRNSWLIALFRRLEKFLYREASHVSLLSEGFRENLVAKGVPNAKLSVVPVWADPDIIYPLPKENAFRRKNGLENKFVVLYAGNIGVTSSLEDVITAASLLKENRDLVFLLVGEGTKKTALVQQAHGLGQVIFLPFQPRSLIAEMLAAADIGLVTLNTESAKYSLPSKVFSIMASERPVLAVAPTESELAQLVEIGKCGLHVPPGEPDELAGKILWLKNESTSATLMGKRGRIELIDRYSRHSCITLVEQVIEKTYSGYQA